MTKLLWCELIAQRRLVYGWAEDFADFAGQVLQGEGFLQEGLVGTGDERLGQGVFGIAGEVEDFGGGTGEKKLLGEFGSAEAGHDDVGDDEVDRVGVRGGLFEGGV